MNKAEHVENLLFDTGVYYEWVEWYEKRPFEDYPESTIEWFYNELDNIGVVSEEQDNIVDYWLMRAYKESKKEAE